MTRKINSGGLLPKISGSLHVEWKTCGKPGCRCVTGQRHGPYWYRRWREHGKQRKAYVRQDQFALLQAAVARGHQSHPPTWSMRQTLAKLRRVAKEVQSCQS